MEYSINISKTDKVDVLVAGGGTAGVFAAISASRNGAKTVLIEKNSILGGTMTSAGVNFPGLFFAWGKRIIGGPCWEAIEQTIALGGGVMPKITFKPEKHWHEQIYVNKFIYSCVLFDMCRQSGVELITNAMISHVNEKDECVEISVTGKNENVLFEAKKVVDTTGDANIIMRAGYETCKSSELQPATLQNHITGYDMSMVSVCEIEEKFKKIDMPPYITSEELISYLHRHIIDVHTPCTDADTSRGKTKLEQNSAAITLKILNFYKSIKGLENIVVDYSASETGVRETNRIVGEVQITEHDYISGLFYPDSVCYSFYPIDLHVLDGIEQRFHECNVVPKIPYRALIPKNSSHIICAGRCISSDTNANSAVRTQSTCMATGQVAGCAAFLASKNNTPISKVSYDELKSILIKLGAIVPSAEGELQ